MKMRYRLTLGKLFWFLTAVSGLGLLLYAGLHGFVVLCVSRGPVAFSSALSFLETPYVLCLELALRFLLYFHVLNGLRLIAYDAGWYGVDDQRDMRVTVLVAATLLFMLHYHLAASYIPFIPWFGR